MTDVTPSLLANAVMAKLYNVLTNGDDTVPKSQDNFFSWCTPGIPVDPEDFQFLTQGLTGVVRSQDVANLIVAGAPVGGAASGSGGTASGSSATGTSGSSSTGSGSGSTQPAPQVLTPDLINQLRAQDTARLYMQAEALARIVDFVPDVTKASNNQFAQFSVASNQGTLSDCWKLILTMSQVMMNDLDQATKDKIAKFRDLLQTTTTKTDLVTGAQTQVTGPSALVQAYNTKMAAYDAAALTYNSARINALAGNDPVAVQNWAINANILRDQVKAAMDDWITNGYKDDYEEIAAYIDQVMARDLTMLKASYKDDLAKATLTGLASGSDFYFTSLVPGDFAQSLGWSRFTFSSGDYSSHSQQAISSSSWNASTFATGSFGFVNFGATASAGGAQQDRSFSSNFNLDSFGLSFEIAQVPIVRPWFKDAFLSSKTWRFDQSNPDVKNQIVSDGGSPPQGLVPAYPTTIVFIRNLVLNIGHVQGFSDFMSHAESSSQSGGGFVGIGPFFCGGQAAHASSKGFAQRNNGYQYDDQGLQVPGMQIVGFKCHVLPKTPNPDPSIKEWV